MKKKKQKEKLNNDRSNEKTHIICILDRSGSMYSIIDDSIGGFNSFLKTQKNLPDDATITVVLFDDKYELLYDNINIKNVEDLTIKKWYPRGSTALYDAIGKTINSEKNRIDNMDHNKPSKVLVCIVTDGNENSSIEFNLGDIKKIIKTSEENNWNFIYLGANQDAFDVGTSFGVSPNNTFTYSADKLGVMDMSATLNEVSTMYRSINTTDDSFYETTKSLIKNKK